MHFTCCIRVLNYMVILLYGYLVIYGFLVIWLYVYLVMYGYLVIWLSGYIWYSGYLVIYGYAKQKHRGCKKGKANQKQQLSD